MFGARAFVMDDAVSAATALAHQLCLGDAVVALSLVRNLEVSKHSHSTRCDVRPGRGYSLRCRRIPSSSSSLDAITGMSGLSVIVVPYHAAGWEGRERVCVGAFDRTKREVLTRRCKQRDGTQITNGGRYKRCHTISPRETPLQQSVSALRFPHSSFSLVHVVGGGKEEGVEVIGRIPSAGSGGEVARSGILFFFFLFALVCLGITRRPESIQKRESPPLKRLKSRAETRIDAARGC